jgi:PST family polysaccharide transporter
MVWLVRKGAPVGFVLMLGLPAAGVALAAAWAARREGCLPSFHWRIAKEDAAYFFRMSLILLSTGVLTTGAPYFVSRLVAARLGLEMAGYYWTAWTLSMAYVTLALGSFGSYYMPSLSRLSDPDQRRSLIRSYLLMAVVVMPILVSLAILFKSMVVRFMFSASLLPALKVMRWMLIGDFFKGISWVLSFPMLAFHEMKWFFWSEVLFTLGLAVFGWLILLMGGSVESLGILFLILYLCYSAIMAFYAFLVHGFSLQRQELFRILVGIALVGTVSALTWNHQTMHWGSVGTGLGLILVFLLLSIRGGLPIRELLAKHSPDLGGA